MVSVDGGLGTVDGATTISAGGSVQLMSDYTTLETFNIDGGREMH